MDRKADPQFGDDQGTRVGAPDETRTPSSHEDSPPARPARQTGAGSEATESSDGSAAGHDREHRSGYGGEGGAPRTPSDTRE